MVSKHVWTRTYTVVVISTRRPNGHVYSGGWLNGKQHGKGTLTKHGEKKMYLWDAGKRIEELELEK